VNVSRTDIEELARYLNMAPAEILRQYTIPDPEDGQTVLRQTKDGCVFLDGNLCTVYEARPRTCREFPFLAGDHASLGREMM
jgi:Fe-S-cluster containining protein